MAKLHLAVVDQDPPFDPGRFDFRWNADFSGYRPVPRAWWDDASYAAYQAGEEDR